MGKTGLIGKQEELARATRSIFKICQVQRISSLTILGGRGEEEDGEGNATVRFLSSGIWYLIFGISGSKIT